MIARGVSFRETWLYDNVPFAGEPRRGRNPQTLAKMLIVHARAANLTLDDIGMRKEELEGFMERAMSHTRDEAF